ncbi:Cactin domain-containing protein [Rozella allomycis CSF55]|uniref:Splicing factor Cactin n=1 Tax=Rozella allomycis (strain CSF55) TaxID=988480 RepID=A0A075ATB9_ROZAC|nr:Cactin domain-containing protein [Rozella allomycis CSF55]|eukprot:EPZ33415.1 Cactin domain-containing protein [Rozella allomycis CSF55]
MKRKFYDPLATVPETEMKKRENKQAKLRAAIRIQQHRAKLIDLFMTNFDLDQDVVFSELLEDPCSILNDQSKEDMQQLSDDIDSIINFCDEPKTSLALKEQRHANPEWKGTIGVSEDVYKNVMSMLQGKTLEELILTEKSIKKKLKSNEPVDTEYWIAILSELKIYKCRNDEDILNPYKISIHEVLISSTQNATNAGKDEQGTRSKVYEKINFPLEASYRFEDDGEATMEWYEREKRKIMLEDEEEFNVEYTEAPVIKYAWQKKYKSKKPIFFNKIIAKHDWNKYNLAHYTIDDPPPKQTFGYKFNVFYPDLVDKTQTPSYKIESNPKDDKTVIIRFVAGPPYEDVCFLIENEEWDYWYKKGFNCTFDRGVMKLHFNFRRYQYKRI